MGKYIDAKGVGHLFEKIKEKLDGVLAPAAHKHGISDVAGLQYRLNTFAYMEKASLTELVRTFKSGLNNAGYGGNKRCAASYNGTVKLTAASNNVPAGLYDYYFNKTYYDGSMQGQATLTSCTMLLVPSDRPAMSVYLVQCLASTTISVRALSTMNP